MWPLADGSQGAPLSLDGANYMTSVPDGLLINTHSLEIIEEKLRSESRNTITTLAARAHSFIKRYVMLISRTTLTHPRFLGGQKLKCCMNILSFKNNLHLTELKYDKDNQGT